jgi:hypothetical protein
MNQTHRADAWREANGGFRGSHLLAGGTALLALGALLALVGLLVGGPDTGSRDGVVVAGWLAYILGLGLVGTGFGWSCIAGILPRAGLAVAVMHVLQSGYLLYMLYGRSQPPVSPVALTVGRLLAVIVFAILAAGALGPRTARILGVAAGLGLAKALLRVLVPAADGGAGVDAAVLLVMAAAFAMAARRLRRIEDEWARNHNMGGRSDFSEFNNPEHDWNKPDETPGKGGAGGRR